MQTIQNRSGAPGPPRLWRSGEGSRPMTSIQLALSNTELTDTLRTQLVRSSGFPVRCVDCPDPADGGVIVVDPEHFQTLHAPIAHPERVVLITSDDPSLLKSAWEAGVNSVVFDRDTVQTLVLAILSACLRTGQTKPVRP